MANILEFYGLFVTGIKTEIDIQFVDVCAADIEIYCIHLVAIYSVARRRVFFINCETNFNIFLMILSYRHLHPTIHVRLCRIIEFRKINLLNL